MGSEDSMPCNSFAECSINKETLCQIRQTNCLEYKGDIRYITCKENNKRYNLQNNGYIVAKYRVDGGIIKSNKIRCDYLLVCYGDENKAIFVELKGHDNKHACEQLYETISVLEANLRRIENIKFYARIVNRKTVPNLFTDRSYTKIFKLLQSINKCKKKYIEFRNNNFDEPISDLN